MHAITLNNITLAHHQKRVIHDFSAEIHTGEFIGIFGPNGAGKSTLLKAILGLLKPTQGNILLFDKPTARGNVTIGYMPQRHIDLNTQALSGRAGLMACFKGHHFGLPVVSKKQQEKIDEVLHQVEATQYADRSFYELSGGEQQRLLLAQALLGSPKILLLDEPLSSLDPKHQDGLIQLIQRIREEHHITILFTAHDLNPLIKVMDRIIYLAEGNAAIGTLDEIVTNQKLSWLYGIPMEVIRTHNHLFVMTQHSGARDNDPHH